MSRRLTLELPNDVYARVEAAAAATSQTPEEWVTTSLPQLLPPPVPNGTANGAMEEDWLPRRCNARPLPRMVRH